MAPKIESPCKRTFSIGNHRWFISAQHSSRALIRAGLILRAWWSLLICPSQMIRNLEENISSDLEKRWLLYPDFSPNNRYQRTFISQHFGAMHITPQIRCKLTPHQLRIWHLRVDLMIVSANITKSSAWEPESLTAAQLQELISWKLTSWRGPNSNQNKGHFALQEYIYREREESHLHS